MVSKEFLIGSVYILLFLHYKDIYLHSPLKSVTQGVYKIQGHIGCLFLLLSEKVYLKFLNWDLSRAFTWRSGRQLS